MRLPGQTKAFGGPKIACYVKFIPLMHYANLSSHMTIEMTERAHSTHCGLAIEKIVQKNINAFQKTFLRFRLEEFVSKRYSKNI